MPKMKDVIGQLWKEYSLSDSRHLSQDTLVICIESMTVLIWGPLSFLVAYLVISKSSLRHPLQALVSTGHLYGDSLYYSTSLYDYYYRGVAYCRPEGYYFWVYYFLMNSFWILVPGGRFSIYPLRASWSIDSATLQQHHGDCRGNCNARSECWKKKKTVKTTSLMKAAIDLLQSKVTVILLPQESGSWRYRNEESIDHIGQPSDQYSFDCYYAFLLLFSYGKN